MKKTYDEDSAVCFKCIEDTVLREYVRTEGEKQVCVECGKSNRAVSVKDLASFIDPVIREHFKPGHFERRYGSGDDDSYCEEQQGDDLSYIVQEVVGQCFESNDALVDALIKHDPADVRHGEDPFYSADISYESTRVYVGHLFEEWQAIGEEVRTERRFFSDRARKFFEWLFEGIEDLWYHEPQDPINFLDESEQVRLGVIQEWPTRTVVCRARLADTKEDCERLIFRPALELAPPPSKFARVGRMNAEGVTIFYGALDARTCLAEMRSSIGSYAVLGQFETTRALRVLDLSRLDKAYWDGKPLSYLQDDFEEQLTRRKFRRQVHRLISKPVVPGREDEYLITQVVAEYLAYVRSPNFDGLLFASTQYDRGTNVVLFPKHSSYTFGDADEGMLGRFPLRYVTDSVEMYRTKAINYDIPQVDFSIVSDRLYLHDSEHDDDDED
jgi:hypothetical protein